MILTGWTTIFPGRFVSTALSMRKGGRKKRKDDISSKCQSVWTVLFPNILT